MIDFAYGVSRVEALPEIFLFVSIESYNHILRQKRIEVKSEIFSSSLREITDMEQSKNSRINWLLFPKLKCDFFLLWLIVYG